MAKRRFSRLEALARDLVGDGKAPNLFFVTCDGNVVAVTRTRTAAQYAARELGETCAAAVEDRKTGVVWENRRALSQQDE